MKNRVKKGQLRWIPQEAEKRKLVGCSIFESLRVDNVTCFFIHSKWKETTICQQRLIVLLMTVFCETIAFLNTPAQWESFSDPGSATGVCWNCFEILQHIEQVLTSIIVVYVEIKATFGRCCINPFVAFAIIKTGDIAILFTWLTDPTELHVEINFGNAARNLIKVFVLNEGEF